MTTYYGTTVVVDLKPITCSHEGCGVHFALDAKFVEARRGDQATWYCPNGHPRWYPPGESDEAKLRRAEAQKVALRDQLEAATREAESVRVALLRDRQRFANGVCPCCNRSFDNVRRHMTTKHPDYDTTKVKQASVVQFSCGCGRHFSTLQGLRVHQGAQRRGDWYAPGASRYSAHLTKV